MHVCVCVCVCVCACVHACVHAWWWKLINSQLYVTSQLQLLQKVQEAEGIISVAMDFVGDQNGLEATLADIQVMEFTYCSALVVPWALSIHKKSGNNGELGGGLGRVGTVHVD